ncbi:MAG: acetylxylan esterase, partial [Opitutales bacterium]|nr:acetylxylan esterase [Opitutales bacterium]
MPEGDAPTDGWPSVVCVHGGWGTAFHEWMAKWNDHGYADISMDLEGHYPINKTERREDGRFATEYPGLNRAGIFNDFEEPVDEQWYYHAVAEAILAHSLIRSYPEVNPDKTGITGISRLGALTSTIMDMDNRFKFAIPVYGCGYLPNSDSRQGLAIKPKKHTEIVNTYFDGSAYFQNVRIPTFWLNGTNDGAFAMLSNQRSAKAVRVPATFRYELRMRHGHRPGWEPREIYAFADSLFGDGPPLIRFDVLRLEGDRAWIAFDSETKVVEGKVYYTKDQGIWNERNWEEAPAKLREAEISSTMPEGVTIFYFATTGERGLMVSSE